MVELETLDLGLTPEGDSLNNRSARDIGNVHQRYKAREDAPVPVFQARSVATAPSSSSTQGEERGCMEEVEQDAETGEAAEGEEQASDGEGKRAGSNARDDAQANKRRKIRFRAPAAEGAATATATATADACSAAAVTAAGAVLEGNVQVFRQDNMTDEQFRSLQNRIKNRPVTSVNGTYEMHISRPIAGMKGHTAFLTFAVAPLMR